MASPSPVPGAPRVRAGSPWWNRSKTSSWSAAGHPGPVVHDVEDDLALDDPDPQLDAGTGVGQGVVEQVPDHPPQLAGVGPDRAGRHVCGVDVGVPGVPCPRRLLEHHRIQVDRGGHRGCALVGRGEHQQVVDEPFHLARRAEHLVAQHLGVDGARARPGPAPTRPVGW